MYTPGSLTFQAVLNFCHDAEKRGDHEAMKACEDAALGDLDALQWVTDRVNETLANANNSNVNNKAND